MQRALLPMVIGLALALSACGGGGGSTTSGGYVAPVAPPAGSPATAQPQAINIALPGGTMGTQNDATFGAISGFTLSGGAQVLGFAPNSQIMLRNLSPATPHTLNVLSTTSFPPSGTAISSSPSGGSTIGTGFSSGTIAANQLVGPFTLVAGTYYIGCAFHYAQGMRDGLIVAANATPGPAATPQPPQPGSTPGAGPGSGPGPGGYY